MAIILLLGIAGIVLIFLEFFLPGAVLAVIGTLTLLISLGLFFAQYPAFWGIVYMLAMLLAVFIICKFALWRVKRSQGKGNFYHGEDQSGYQASSYDQNLIGKDGIVATELKPAGHILVDGKLYQALSETGFISKDVSVQIVGGKGSHLIVRQRQ
ncbi:MAG: serine protease [Verrucomicrobia bacterium]|nr:serine protease [Verrucomicrobiota bacterium]